MMPKITVRECPKTGKFFKSDAAYRIHIRALRKTTNTDRAMIRYRKTLTKKIRNEVNKLKNIEEIETYVARSFGDILIAHNGTKDPKVHRILQKTKLTNFSLDVSYEDMASNTHASPRDGITNWSGKKTRFRGYPGFTGTIEYTVENNPEDNKELNHLWMRINDALGYVGIHTGSGGARGGKHRYSVTLFISDFEGLRKTVFKDKLSCIS